MAVATKAKTPPPPPKPRKAVPINAEFEGKAKIIVRKAMEKKNVSIDELHDRLKDMGVKISAGGLANKISRGGFSAMFMVQCLVAMDAMDIDLATLLQ